MTSQIVRVDWRGADQQGITGSFTFDDVESINLKLDSGAKESHGSIVLKNTIDRFKTGFNQPFSKYNSDTNNIRFDEGDSVKIYAASISSYREIDTTSDSADLIMSGEVAEVNIKGESGSCKISLKIVDKTYSILNRLHPKVYSSADAMNAPEIIQDIVRWVTQDIDSDEDSYDSSGNRITNGKYGVDARLITEGGYIEDERINGSVFPDLSMAKVAKPAYDWIKDLSSVESTNNFDDGDDENSPTQDRNMLFYIDERNRFHWFYPKDVITTTLNENLDDSETTITLTSTDDFPSQGTIFIDAERIDYTGITSNDLTGCTRGANNTTATTHSSGDTVRNAISIIEGDTSSGYTLNSYNLTKKTFDIVNFVIFSAGADMKGNGITAYFFNKSTKSKSLKDTNKSWNDIASKLMQAEINDGRLTKDNTTSSPFTFKGNRYKETTGDYNGGSGITTSWGVTVTSDNAYNAAFRAKCILEGRRKAEALTGIRGNPRWKGTMNFKFHRFTAGELFEFTSTKAGLNKQSLRIKTVQYNLTKSGAFVTLTVEEDEGKLT